MNDWMIVSGFTGCHGRAEKSVKVCTTPTQRRQMKQQKQPSFGQIIKTGKKTALCSVLLSYIKPQRQLNVTVQVKNEIQDYIKN